VYVDLRKEYRKLCEQCNETDKSSGDRKGFVRKHYERWKGKVLKKTSSAETIASEGEISSTEENYKYEDLDVRENVLEESMKKSVAQISELQEQCTNRKAE